MLDKYIKKIKNKLKKIPKLKKVYKINYNNRVDFLYLPKIYSAKKTSIQRTFICI